MPKVETRKSEVRIFTSNPQDMIGKYLAQPLQRKWIEDFVDEETNEVVSIERGETIASAGELIDNDLQAQINFFISEGSINGVEVTNQRRAATLYKGVELTPWVVSASINGKNKKFLLYADSLLMAQEVAKDFIELNYEGIFSIPAIKSFGNCIVIMHDIDNFDSDENEEQDTAEEAVDKKFYKVTITATWDEDRAGTFVFIVNACDVDAAIEIIHEYIGQMIRVEKSKDGNTSDFFDFQSKLQDARAIPINVIISKDFSIAYTQEVGDGKV